MVRSSGGIDVMFYSREQTRTLTSVAKAESDPFDNLYRSSLIDVLRSTRFGLPVDFAAIVIHPSRKATKRLRDVLDQLFGYLDQSSKSKNNEVNEMNDSSSILHVFSRKSTFRASSLLRKITIRTSILN
jgi:hypothetical protein